MMFLRVLKQIFRPRGAAAAAAPAPASPAEDGAAAQMDAARSMARGQQAENEGRYEEALACYEAGLALYGDSAELNTKLGNLLRALDRHIEAILAYRAAVLLKPDFAPAQNNLGVALCAQNEVAEAIECFRKAIAIEPGLAAAHENLGGIYFGQGRVAESLASYRQVLATQPDNGNALHMIAAMTGGNPERAPDQYVAKVFDDYAGNFDAHLLLGLKYHAPSRLVAMIREHMDPALHQWEVLDLGCGTGLFGVEIAGMARHLVGVDLSPKMLQKARLKNCYTRLEVSDLHAMMLTEPAASYDVIAAADVFIYTGRLDAIVQEAKRLLRPGGALAFSVEALDAGREAKAGAIISDDYRLATTGRYAHCSRYLERLAREHGFIQRKLVGTDIRQERDVPVAGWLVLWEQPGRADARAGA